MTGKLPLSEDGILELVTEFNLTKEQIIDFNAEFKAYDKGNKGKITSEDLSIVNREFGSHTSEEVLQEWIKECDSDGDDKVDLKEFIKCKIKDIDKENNNNNKYEGM